jgi:repressor LexA
MGELSERQASILEFIARHCDRNGYPPTVREIGMAVGLASPSTVHAHLAKLEAAGYIKRDPTKPRAMLVRELDSEDLHPLPPEGALPLVGAVAAGGPKLAEDLIEDWVQSPFAGDFMLRVTGDSMVNAGIFDGDLVVVKRQDTAEEGEIVVARIEDEATVKTLRLDGERVVLQPENDAYAPITADEVAIVGRVVGVLRAL